MDTKSAVELMESSAEVHFSGFHMDGFEQRKASIEQPTTSETDMYKQPFVIGVFSYDKLPNKFTWGLQVALQSTWIKSLLLKQNFVLVEVIEFHMGATYVSGQNSCLMWKEIKNSSCLSY